MTLSLPSLPGVLMALLVAVAGAAAQVDGALIERYLDEPTEAAALLHLDTLIRDCRGREAELRTALMARPPESASSRDFAMRVNHLGRAWAVTVQRGDAAPSAGAPVVFDIAGGTVAAKLGLRGVVTCFVPGYKPPEFSDEGRDGYLKFLNGVIHAVGGDPDRAWLCGYSWAAHASFDTALHRPLAVRGIVTLGGGPRRVHFRLLPHLAGVRCLALCGANDDPELVWNLGEVSRSAPKLGLDYRLTLDPDAGHSLLLAGVAEVGGIILETPAVPPAIPSAGVLLADGVGIELPWLRIDAVDADAVTVPSRVPVAATLSPDEARRATIEAMRKKVARLQWKYVRREDRAVLTLTGSGVRRATLFLRPPWFTDDLPIDVLVGGKRVFSGKPVPDVAQILGDARRTGRRTRPIIGSVALEF